MTGVDKDLATLLDPFKMPSEHEAAVNRVEAELSRLREQRDAAVEAMHSTSDSRDDWRRWAEQHRDRADALSARCAELAEQGRIAAKRYGEYVARCARLQQALDDAFVSFADTGWGRAYRELCSWSESGPDTPADRQRRCDEPHIR